MSDLSQRALTDEEALIVEREMNLVRWVIRQWFRGYNHWREDLEQAGMIGLCEAVHAYEQAKLRNPAICSWTHFARRYIRSQIMDEIGRQRHFYVPKYHFHKVNSTDPGSLKRIASQKKNAAAVQAAISAQRVRWRDEEAHAVLAVARDQKPDDRIESIREVIESLGTKERIVMQRCGLGGQTQRAVASDMGITKERVGQIRQKALQRIRERFTDEQVPVRRI